ncbi:MAG: hypothetical protein OXT09_31030, partial [Myxococcales bacterium]|nr:hypothetical protein [Myxococcales bacterium]
SVSGFVKRQLQGAPRFALMLDGGEDVARAYLAAANIPDSDGDYAWPDASPDALTAAEIAGAVATLDGDLLDGTGSPTHCGLISAGWPEVDARTATGIEAIDEVRAFLEFPTLLFAHDESVLSFENSSNGVMLTLAGYNTGTMPAALTETNSDFPPVQSDGPFNAAGGVFPAFTLPQPDDYRDNDAVFLTEDSSAPGTNDLLVVGRLDGDCSIVNETCNSGEAEGKLFYLGGSGYSTTTPITSNPSTNGTRLFLNALFEAECATERERPDPTVSIFGPSSSTDPLVDYTIGYLNDGDGIAHGTTIEYTPPVGSTYQSSTGGGVWDGAKVTWTLDSLEPGEAGLLGVQVLYADFGSYGNQATLDYHHGNTPRSTLSYVITTSYTSTPDLMCTSLGVNDISIPSTNEDQITAYSVGELNGRIFLVNSSTSGMNGDLLGSDFTPCAAADASPDALIHFELTSPANVTINTEGTSWDTVLGLYDGLVDPSDSVTATNTNESTEAFQDLGTVNGKRINVGGGDTSVMTADYVEAELGCSAPSTDNSGDAVYRFDLSADTTVKISTEGSSFDTILSLHDGAIQDPSSQISASTGNTNESDIRSPYVAMQPLNGFDQLYDGDTSAMDADVAIDESCYGWAAAECPWGACPNTMSSPDAVVKFSVTTAGTYEINTTGSSFDTVLAVFAAATIGMTTAPAVTTGDANEDEARAY